MADPKNKWAQPAAPPSPMFFGKKERDLVKQVNDELAERVVGQSIAYYPISIEASNFNDIYGEAIEKVSLPPVRVYAFVEVENEQTHDRYGYEYKSKLTVNFHRKRLTADQNLFVRVGDFVQYGDQFYEIVRTYNDTRYYFGQVEHKFQISAECITARAGTFRVMPSIDRTPPVTSSTSAGPVAEPRSAPYPPVDAEFITVALDDRLTNARYLDAGDGITLTDGGRRSTLSISATGQNAVGDTGSVQFQTGGGTFSGSANLLFLTASSTLSLTDLSASVNVSASAFYGDGSNLSGLTTEPAGATTQIQYNATGAFAGSSNLTFNGTTLTGSYTGSLAEVTTLSASLMNLLPTSGTLAGTGSYLGLDASYNLVLTSAAAAPGGASTQVQYNNAGSFAGSSNLTFNGTTLTASYTGSLAELTTLSASAINFILSSGSLAGDGSYLGLDSSNNIVLTASSTSSAAVAGSTTEVQYNSGGSFAASSNLTFNGTTLTGSYTGSLAELTTVSASALSVSGDTTLGDASGDTVTITGQTIVLSNVAAGTDNTVLVYNGSSIVTDEIDSRVWGSTLVDASGTPSNNQVGIWTDANTLEGDSSLTFNGTTLTGSYTGSLAELTTVSASTLSVSGDATLGDASGDTVTLTGQTIVLSNIAAGTDNTVLVYNGSSIVTDEIDSRVWGSTLVDASGTPSNNQVGIWTDANTLEGDSSLTFNGTTLTGSYTGSLAELTTLSASATLVTGDSYLSGGLIHKRVSVSSNYTASITDYILGVASVPVSIIFDATSFTDGQVVVIKDESGAASVANPVALSASASQTIDGEGNVAIESPYGAIQLYSDGANWYIY
tara:strand:+ start:1006 stop:3519 length:2514 start_codon:yes stop_codon:yes gene_type:complete